MGYHVPYLLRTQAQIDAFRANYADIIKEKGETMREWFNRLPLYEWTRLQCRPGQESVTVGLLCHLYIEGQINITFSRDGDYIQRGALTQEEHEEWIKSHYRHCTE